MSFFVLPPEINSTLMYAGAGSAPMLAAATAWDGLAAELGSAAQTFSSITSGLAGEAWQGTASTAMLSTAAQYSGVLSAAAAQAQSAAAQAQTVASAFESAVVATVHPALVSANRNELVQLVVSNLFGQNAPAIAAAESDYEQMWASDVAAMVDYHGGVSAAASQLTSWSAALRGLPAQASAAINTAPVAAALNSLTPAASNPLATIEKYAIAAINGPTEFLIGRPLIGTAPAVGLGGTVNGGTATAPLTLYGGAEPLVNASVGGGAPVPLLVDTGSTGLVIPFQNAGGLLGTLQLGLPSGFGIGGYSGGINYLYATYNAPVNFGGGLVTSRTPVDIELFAWPASFSAAMNHGLTFQSYFAQDGASGVLGVGPNAGGPGPSIATQALPAPYNTGLLINETGANPYLQFGAPPTNLNPIATFAGSPIATLGISTGPLGWLGPQYSVNSVIDSGGVSGTIPTGLNVVPGEAVYVYAPNGALLYSFIYDGTYSPTPSPYIMNTGALPFLAHPVYVSYSPGGVGTTTFYQ
jgi:PPE-repeat protein